MNSREFAHLETLQTTIESISIADLTDLNARTLLYGYTCDRNTWHVYLFDLEIHRLVYDERTAGHGARTKPIILSRDKATTWAKAADLIPDKRLYPEACDFEFCSLLKTRRFSLPFTSFNDQRELLQFHGLI